MKGKVVENTELQVSEPNTVMIVPSEMEDLSKYDESPIELATSYWTPAEVGETRRAYFMGISKQTFPEADAKEGEEKFKTISCANFCVQNKDGSVDQFANGSKRLLAIFEHLEGKQGKPFAIKYLGKVKNANNAFKSDDWSAKELLPKGSN